MKKILLLALMIQTTLIGCKQSKADLSDCEHVYICTGKYSTAFHARRDCNGLKNCSGNIQFLPIEDVIGSHHPCSMCIRISDDSDRFARSDKEESANKQPEPEWISMDATEKDTEEYYWSDIAKTKSGDYSIWTKTVYPIDSTKLKKGESVTREIRQQYIISDDYLEMRDGDYVAYDHNGNVKQSYNSPHKWEAVIPGTYGYYIAAIVKKSNPSQLR